MRLNTIILIWLMLAVPGFSQVSAVDSVINRGNRLYQPKKLNYSLSLGSEFTAVSGFGSALNSWVTPQVSYNLNKKLSIGGGISIIQTNYFDARPWFGNEQTAASNGNFTSALVFVNGQYRVNDRLTVFGSAFKQFPVTQDPLPYNPFNPVSKKGAQGVDLNVGYRIGEHVFIQAGFRYTEGVNPYYNDPFQSNSPFGNNFGRSCGYGVPRW